jgi:hypothetical protein
LFEHCDNWKVFKLQRVDFGWHHATVRSPMQTLFEAVPAQTARDPDPSPRQSAELLTGGAISRNIVHELCLTVHAR